MLMLLLYMSLAPLPIGTLGPSCLKLRLVGGTGLVLLSSLTSADLRPIVFGLNNGSWDIFSL